MKVVAVDWMESQYCLQLSHHIQTGDISPWSLFWPCQHSDYSFIWQTYHMAQSKEGHHMKNEEVLVLKSQFCSLEGLSLYLRAPKLGLQEWTKKTQRLQSWAPDLKKKVQFDRILTRKILELSVVWKLCSSGHPKSHERSVPLPQSQHFCF